MLLSALVGILVEQNPCPEGVEPSTESPEGGMPQHESVVHEARSFTTQSPTITKFQLVLAAGDMISN